MLSSSLYALALLAASALADNDGCSCFLVNSTANNGQAGTESFQQYFFTDFSDARLNQDPSVPPPVRNTNGNPNKTTNSFFNESEFSSMWSFAAGTVNNPYNDNGKDTLFNTAQNAYIAPVNSSTNENLLRLRTTHLSDKEDSSDLAAIPPTTLSGAALVSTQQVLYASFRMRARVNSTIGGTVAGLYMHRNEANGSALEIRSRELSTAVFASMQMQPQNTSETTIPNGGKWEDFHTYRLDWTPQALSAWVDETLLVTRVASDPGVTIPSGPTTLQLALGADSGDWTGFFPVDDSTNLDIQWIELAYNTSTPAGTANCGAGANFCGIDDESKEGQPRGGAEPSSMASSSGRIGSAWLVVCVSVVMMFL